MEEKVAEIFEFELLDNCSKCWSDNQKYETGQSQKVKSEEKDL